MGINQTPFSKWLLTWGPNFPLPVNSLHQQKPLIIKKYLEGIALIENEHKLCQYADDTLVFMNAYERIWK